MLRTALVFLLGCGLFSAVAMADEQAPWGRAEAASSTYQPMKVVYDVTTGDAAEMALLLDRVSTLSAITGADPFDQSIVLVIHGDAIKFFATRNFAAYEDLQRRAQSLTVGDVIQIRLCQLAARGQGLGPEDIHGFVDMVPMGDAEIVRLQVEEAHAYMH